jgi:hypothetical protein
MSRRRKGRVSAINLSKAIKEIVEEYGSQVSFQLNDSIKEVTREAEDKLQAVKRFAPDGHPTGAYSDDWQSSVVDTGRFTIRGTVYNGSHYRLAHLLEFGHVTRNGTDRTFDRTPAYPHIAKVNDWAHDELIRNIKKKLEDME